MAENVVQIVPQFLVGGEPVPISAYDVTLGTYGSAGHANLTTSRSLLRSEGVDLVALASQAATSLEVGLTLELDGDTVKLFGGEYVSASWEYDSDVVSIHCRDYAGLLTDQKRVISTIAQKTAQALAPGQNASSGGISNQNQSLSQLVTAIANEFNLTPVLNIQESNDPTVGSILGSSDTVFMPTPKSLWGILCRLARETGYDVHVTPQRELVFGLPGTGGQPLALAYNVPGAYGQGLIPCRGLSIQHNPRRNLSFRVLVLSYDPAKGQTTRGEAYVIGSNASVNGSTTVNPGAWSGPQATQITNSLNEPSAARGGNLQIPLYTIRTDGLTQAQAQQKATAIAGDISKRELILQATIDTTPGIVPLNLLTITGDVEAEFSGHKFYVNSARHVYRQPGARSPRGEVSTRIGALDVQVQGSGDPITTGGANA